MNNRRLVTCVTASLLLTALSLAFLDADTAFVLCAGIALASGLWLLIRSVVNKGRPRVVVLCTFLCYLLVQAFLLTNYTLVRDHLRWALLSGTYRAKVLAQPAGPNQELRHVEWDGWGFVGSDTTVFLALDPTDSLAEHVATSPPIKAPGLPCEVVRIRRLAKQWYAVLFYTETYWGQGTCQ